ncbi:hypothetical protein AA106555_0980 [Neokomagataea thailandica NBRC 106555]|uniref:Peroxiredoxin n=2 Tax=Neokomagataea TaxID=1223423 RepID=A0A4Y6V6H8_9PROT|nr:MULTISPECIES: hypothetical protein [Neokomagataea]QDH25583.1 hypothetical protein D5366_10545 [Neokomagataea tanensis]GBR52627.1 hypothetical protein AA106555_0980 [Neokomagataea thailandica NBRC 106555]
MSNPLFISLADDSWQRAHYALIMAASALSLGRPVTLFAGGRSVLAFTHQWENLTGVISDTILSEQKVATFVELRDACLELGGVFLACETGLALANLAPEDLINGAEAAGMVRFLAETGENSIIVV